MNKGLKRIKVGAKEGVLNSQKIGLRDPIIEKRFKNLCSDRSICI